MKRTTRTGMGTSTSLLSLVFRILGLSKPPSQCFLPSKRQSWRPNLKVMESIEYKNMHVWRPNSNRLVKLWWLTFPKEMKQRPNLSNYVSLGDCYQRKFEFPAYSRYQANSCCHPSIGSMLYENLGDWRFPLLWLLCSISSDCLWLTVFPWEQFIRDESVKLGAFLSTLYQFYLARIDDSAPRRIHATE